MLEISAAFGRIEHSDLLETIVLKFGSLVTFVALYKLRITMTS